MLKTTKVLKASILSTVLLINTGCNEEQRFVTDQMGNRIMTVCDIPENLDYFSKAIESVVGNEITAKELYLLKQTFDVRVDKTGYDILFSKTEKARFILLEKKCTANDAVPYSFLVGVVLNNSGGVVFRQFFLVYEKEAFLQDKRQFRFESMSGGEKNYEEVISKKTKGFNAEQLDVYMRSLNCIELEPLSASNSKRYYFHIEPKTNFLSRMFVWDVSLEITANFDSTGVVSNIVVLNRTVSKKD